MKFVVTAKVEARRARLDCLTFETHSTEPLDERTHVHTPCVGAPRLQQRHIGFRRCSLFTEDEEK